MQQQKHRTHEQLVDRMELLLEVSDLLDEIIDIPECPDDLRHVARNAAIEADYESREIAERLRLGA